MWRKSVFDEETLLTTLGKKYSASSIVFSKSDEYYTAVSLCRRANPTTSYSSIAHKPLISIHTQMISLSLYT